MNNPGRFKMSGQDAAAEPYHYTMCGLDDIYLVNGFTREESDYGPGVSIAHADELHKAIGAWLIVNRKTLSPKELRFLRKEMGLTQKDLGERLGLTNQSIARYEKGEVDIPGPVDQLLRFTYAFHLLPEDEQFAVLKEIRQALEEFEDVDDVPPHPIFFEPNDGGWQGRENA